MINVQLNMFTIHKTNYVKKLKLLLLNYKIAKNNQTNNVYNVKMVIIHQIIIVASMENIIMEIIVNKYQLIIVQCLSIINVKSVFFKTIYPKIKLFMNINFLMILYFRKFISIQILTLNFIIKTIFYNKDHVVLWDKLLI